MPGDVPGEPGSCARWWRGGPCDRRGGPHQQRSWRGDGAQPQDRLYVSRDSGVQRRRGVRDNRLPAPSERNPPEGQRERALYLTGRSADRDRQPVRTDRSRRQSVGAQRTLDRRQLIPRGAESLSELGGSQVVAVGARPRRGGTPAHRPDVRDVTRSWRALDAGIEGQPVERFLLLPVGGRRFDWTTRRAQGAQVGCLHRHSDDAPFLGTRCGAGSQGQC